MLSSENNSVAIIFLKVGKILKKAFLIYYDYFKHFDLLTDEQLGKLIRALKEYDDTGEYPKFDDGALKMSFSFIKYNLDRDRIKWEAIQARNKSNGIKGGRPKNLL